MNFLYSDIHTIIFKYLGKNDCDNMTLINKRMSSIYTKIEKDYLINHKIKFKRSYDALRKHHVGSLRRSIKKINKYTQRDILELMLFYDTIPKKQIKYCISFYKFRQSESYTKATHRYLYHCYCYLDNISEDVSNHKQNVKREILLKKYIDKRIEKCLLAGDIFFKNL